MERVSTQCLDASPVVERDICSKSLLIDYHKPERVVARAANGTAPAVHCDRVRFRRRGSDEHIQYLSGLCLIQRDMTFITLYALLYVVPIILGTAPHEDGVSQQERIFTRTV